MSPSEIARKSFCGSRLDDSQGLRFGQNHHLGAFLFGPTSSGMSVSHLVDSENASTLIFLLPPYYDYQNHENQS
jgi:hypothetical protein